MKLLTKTAAILGAALAVAGTASAQTTLRIVGATTYKAPVHQAICKVLDSGFTFQCDNVNPYQQKVAIYVGKLNVNYPGAGNPATDPSVIIKTFWTGSAAGTYDVAKATNLSGSFLADADATATFAGFDGTTGATLFTGSINANTTKETGTIPADVTLSDAFASTVQASVKTANTGGNAAATLIGSASFAHAGTAAGTNGGPIGIVAFQYVLGVASGTQPLSLAAGTANLTQQQGLQLVSGGLLPVGFLTGLSADLNKYLVLVGRNEDSGSRIEAVAEVNAGNNYGTQSVVQFLPGYTATPANAETNGTTTYDTGGSGFTVNSFAKFPVVALNGNTGIKWSTLGHSGFLSGGSVRNVLQATNPHAVASITDTNTVLPSGATDVYFVGYLGTGDNFVGGNSVSLDYNGVPFSAANVRNGSYSLWAYEHMYYLTANVSGGGVAITAAKQQIADIIADDIFANEVTVNQGIKNVYPPTASVYGDQTGAPATGITIDSTVKVTRQFEGKVVTRNSN